MNNKIIILSTLAIVAGIILVNKTSTNPTKSTPLIEESIVEVKEVFDFTGEKGEQVSVSEGKVLIPTTSFETNKVKFFNTKVDDGTVVYFLVLKDTDGNYRVAANANEQCAQYGKGYKQEGDRLVCLTCGKSYPIKDFAIEQPNCNPKPLTAKAETDGKSINILSSDLQKLSYLFN